jgi:TonB family protein
MKIYFVFTVFLTISLYVFGQEESCSFAEEAWNGDTVAMKKFLATCGRVDTISLDEHNKPVKNNPHHQVVSLRLNSGKVLHTDSLFYVVENMPKYPGGDGALFKYLSESIQYPEKAKKGKVEGRVFISFVIERDGKVNQLRVTHGIGNGCDEEAARVVRNMKPWIPGTQNGKAVRVKYTLPVKFALSK